MPFLIAGAPDRARAMGIEVIARLPQGARLALEAPPALLERFGFKKPQVELTRRRTRVALRPHGRQDLGLVRFPAKFRARARLLATLPKAAQREDGWQVVVRQYAGDERQEVGRVTWYLASPEFFERRKHFEECLFGGVRPRRQA